jgi:hypothetical protein
MSKTARILGFLLEGANSGTFGYQADLCYKLAKNINLKVTKEGAGLVSEFTEV